jgi:8-oxo-dGTP diphosphatase
MRPTIGVYLEQPFAMEKITRIGIAIVVHADHVLVGVRQDGQVLAGKAEFPGGKCERDESADACAVRECLEETGVSVNPLRLINRLQHRYDHGSVDLSFYLCELVDGKTIEPHNLPLAVPPFRWIPLSDIGTLDFPAANQAVVDVLLK